MRIKLGSVAIICSSLIIASEVMAKSLFINCPAREVETSVTSRISSPWWSTPYAGRQSGVEVRQIGGQPILSCMYEGSAGEVAVVRRLPPGYGSCRAEGEGFRCVKGGASLRVNCPVSQVTTDVSNRLAKPWWSTPVAGPLQDVSVINIAGSPALACFYQGRSSNVVSVMRPYPPGYASCRTERNGFRCEGNRSLAPGGYVKDHKQTVKTDKSQPVGGARKQHDQVVRSGDKSKKTTAKSVCTDLKISKIYVDNINRRPDKSYDFTLYGNLENSSGNDWISAEGQQSIHVYENKKLVREAPFGNVPNNTYTGYHLDVQNWRLNNPRSPDYSYRIVYDPDTKTDDNPNNDDCQSSNNFMHISKRKIDEAIRESGR